MVKTKRRPSLVAMANAKLDEVRAALAWVFDVASLEGDEWTAATVTAVRRALGDEATNSKLNVMPRRKVGKR